MNVHVHANTKVPNMMRVQIQLNVNDGQTYRFQAICRARKAILGPTPGNEHKSSAVFGTSDAKSSWSLWAVCLIYLH